MEGWIKLHRKFISWEWYQDSKMVRLFIHFLLMANHKSKKWQGVEIKRGQFITGLPKLALQTGLSVQSIRTCLDKLESTGEINRQTNSKYSIITVCNYDDYQGEDDDTNRQTNIPTTGNQQASNSQSTTTNNVKKVKNVNKKKVSESSYKLFYREQWDISNGNPLASKYQHIIKYIMNIDKNVIDEPGEHILKLKKQLSFEQFEALQSYCDKRSTSVKEMIDSWLNKPSYSNGRVSVYACLRKWAGKAPMAGTNFQDNKKPIMKTSIGKI